MAKLTLKEATILVANYNVSGQTNEATLDIENPNVDVSNFGGNGWKEYLPGIAGASGQVRGFVDNATDFDADQVSGLQGVPILIGHNNPLVLGDVVHAYKANQQAFQRRHAVGDAAGWSGSFVADGAPSRSTVLHILSAETATGNGAGVNIRATSSAQRVFAYLWVTSVSGSSPTLDVVLESDASDSWAGAETARFTFTQETDATAGYQVATPIYGPITDTWWRATWTTGGTSESFTFAVALGIG